MVNVPFETIQHVECRITDITSLSNMRQMKVLVMQFIWFYINNNEIHDEMAIGNSNMIQDAIGYLNICIRTYKWKLHICVFHLKLWSASAIGGVNHVMWNITCMIDGLVWLYTWFINFVFYSRNGLFWRICSIKSVQWSHFINFNRFQKPKGRQLNWIFRFQISFHMFMFYYPFFEREKSIHFNMTKIYQYHSGYSLLT